METKGITFQIFGCISYVYKLDDDSIKCKFVGYSAETKGYHFYDPFTNIVGHDVIIDAKSA